MAIKHARRVAASAKSQDLLAASEAGDVALNKELMKTLGDKSIGQSGPDCLDGRVTHATILKRFRECYQDLYNSASSKDAMASIKEKLKGQ